MEIPGLISDEDHLKSFLTDAAGVRGGHAIGVVHPGTVDEVAEVLRAALVSGTPVTVSGAGTGLSGGRVPNGGIVLATDRIRRDLSYNAVTGHLHVAAGHRLAEIQDFAAANGRLYPPDPTESLAQIGGNISTNASGARTLMYGPTRAWVEGVTVVLAGGDVLRLRRGEQLADGRSLSLRTQSDRGIGITLPEYRSPDTSKNAAGYFVAPGMDAVDLFIGSEGTLGVVVDAELRTIDAPSTLFGGLLFFQNEDRLLDFVDVLRRGETACRPRCIEFIDRAALDAVRRDHPQIPAEAGGGAIWFEQEGEDMDVLEEWDRVMREHSDLVDSSLFGLDQGHHRRLRAIRHAVPTTAHEILSSRGVRKYGTDIAVPHARFREMFRFYREYISNAGLESMIWGHIGNAHVHVNILPRSVDEEEEAKQAFDAFVKRGLELGGTVSAEHGIGKIKREYLELMVGPSVIDGFREIRRALDPEGILGKGTIIRED